MRLSSLKQDPASRSRELMKLSASKKPPSTGEVIETLARGINAKSDMRRQEIIGKAFDTLNDRRRIDVIPDHDERYKKLATDYATLTKDGHENTMVVSPTLWEAREVTLSIREKLKENGKLGQEDSVFTRLKSTRFTDAQKQVQKNYLKDDVVEFHQNAKGFYAGRRYVVSGYDEHGNVLVKGKDEDMPQILPYNKQDRFDVYRQHDIALAQNELIRITKNSKSMDGVSLYNRNTYQVTGFDQDRNIKLSNGQVLHKNAQHFDYGYVSTSYAAQGKDAKNVLLAQSSGSFRASSDKQFYVSVSRGSEDVRIYTDDKQELRSAVSQNGDTLSATEIAHHEREQRIEEYHEDQERWQRRFEQERQQMEYFENHVGKVNQNLVTEYKNVSNDQGQLSKTQLERGTQPDR